MSESQCMQDLRKAGKVYPRTCAECGLGPCKWYPKPLSYFADGDSVYYCVALEKRELFLTVHELPDCTKTPAQQAATIARILNSDASLDFRIFRE